MNSITCAVLPCRILIFNNWVSYMQSSRRYRRGESTVPAPLLYRACPAASNSNINRREASRQSPLLPRPRNPDLGGVILGRESLTYYGTKPGPMTRAGGLTIL